MSYPPIFTAVRAHAPATALLGSSPTRFYPFGMAPQTPALPYAVWRNIGGSPENYLGDRPDVDSYALQVDVYGASADTVRDVIEAVRDAVEGLSHVTRWGGTDRDPETKNYHESFDIDWFVKR